VNQKVLIHFYSSFKIKRNDKLNLIDKNKDIVNLCSGEIDYLLSQDQGSGSENYELTECNILELECFNFF
jgi:hypothetical protein